jgi:ATP/maltotriose-dependent transcriptional regulator MalT
VDYELLLQAGDTYYLAPMAALLARLVREQGRDDEALALTEVAEAASEPDDPDSQALWRSARAPILARSGQLAQAEELARTAVEFVRQTEAPVLQADALADMATVLQIAGKLQDARAALDEAISLYTAKGNIVSAEQCKKTAGGLRSPPG